METQNVNSRCDLCIFHDHGASFVELLRILKPSKKRKNTTTFFVQPLGPLEANGKFHIKPGTFWRNRKKNKEEDQQLKRKLVKIGWVPFTLPIEY